VRLVGEGRSGNWLSLNQGNGLRLEWQTSADRVDLQLRPAR